MFYADLLKEKRGGEFLENRKKTNRGGECSWWCDWSVSQIFLIFFYKNTNETLKSLFSGKAVTILHSCLCFDDKLGIYGTKYLRMDQVKFVEDNL